MPDFQPTPEQVRILGHSWNSHARVLAGPGTGKSATLVAYIHRLATVADPPRVRLLTFTRAATGELAQKVADDTGIEHTKPSTMHSFAISVLAQNPGAGDLPHPIRIADKWEDRQVIEPHLARRLGITPTLLRELKKEMASNWDSLQDRNEPQIDPQVRARFTGGWHEHRRVFGYTLLQELPYRLHQVLTAHQRVIGTEIDLMVVDEYQDLNACDLGVLRLLAQRGVILIAAGDDDQSIYSFRKAAPEGIRDFTTHYEHAQDYTLSIAQRCGSLIVDWANYVISGDPDRPQDRPILTSGENAPQGEISLLSFANQRVEADGIARLAAQLVKEKGVDPGEILICFRSDHNNLFTRPVKDALERHGIPYSDPEGVNSILDTSPNRHLIELVKLIVNPSDSVAWAAIMRLYAGIGPGFIDSVYRYALQNHLQFSGALFDILANGRVSGVPPAVARRAREAFHWITALVNTVTVPDRSEVEGWGTWMLQLDTNRLFGPTTDEFRTLIEKVDSNFFEPDLGRYINQLTPIAKDIESAKSDRVRVMTLTMSKGLTVRATIIGGVEEGVVPRDGAELAEERRLLYVGMTRAREFLYCTWAARRTGPTARAGRENVGRMRGHSHFLNDGPVTSQDGLAYLRDMGAL